MADEPIRAEATNDEETQVMEIPTAKMRVKLMVSHPYGAHPRVKMAKVDGCTFYKKGDSWVHVDNACRKAAHWDWKIRLVIDGCSLSRVSGEWKHEVICDKAKAFAEMEAQQAALEKAKTDEERTAIGPAAKVKKPRCLATDVEEDTSLPIFIAGWSFEMSGDLLRLRETVNMPRGMKVLYEKVEHVEIHLTRQIGGNVKDFTTAALAAIAQVKIPADLRQHLTVEV